jgi:hypothetical protein
MDAHKIKLSGKTGKIVPQVVFQIEIAKPLQ